MNTSRQITINLNVLTPDEVETLIRLLWSADKDACSGNDALKTMRHYRNLTSQEDMDKLMNSIDSK